MLSYAFIATSRSNSTVTYKRVYSKCHVLFILWKVERSSHIGTNLCPKAAAH